MAPSGLDTGLRAGYLPSNVGLLEDASLRPVVYAGFWRRFVAALLDGLILWVIETIVALIIAAVASGAAARSSTAATIGLVLFVLDFLIGILYYALQESSAKQATLGKRALGIMVTDTHGRPISFGRALGRTLAKFISGLILLIGYLMAAFTARKQALHDLMADTLVVVGHASDRG
jgi:uncharacterized RDD family membrane protein YckC